MIKRLADYAAKHDKRTAMADITPPSHICSLYNTQPSADADAYSRFMGSLVQPIRASHDDLMEHGIALITQQELASEVYSLDSPTILLKHFNRGGAGATYELFMGLLIVSIKVLNIEGPEERYREKCGYEGEPEQVEIIGEEGGMYMACRTYCSGNEWLAADNLTPESLEVKNKGLRDFLLEVAIAKLCSLLKIGPQFKKPLKFDALRFEDCMEYHLEIFEHPSMRVLQEQQSQLGRDLKQAVKILHELHLVRLGITPSNLLYNPERKKFLIGRLKRVEFTHQSQGYACEGTSESTLVDRYNEDVIHLEQLLSSLQEGQPTATPPVMRQKRSQFDQIIRQAAEIYFDYSTPKHISTSPLKQNFADTFPELMPELTKASPTRPVNTNFLVRSMLSQEDLRPVIEWNFSLSEEEKASLGHVVNSFSAVSTQQYETRALLSCSNADSDRFASIFQRHLALLKRGSNRLSQVSYLCFHQYLRNMMCYRSKFGQKDLRRFEESLQLMLSFQPDTIQMRDSFQVLKNLLEGPFEAVMGLLEAQRSNTRVFQQVVYLLYCQSSWQSLLFVIEHYRLHVPSLAGVRFYAISQLYNEECAIKQTLEQLATEIYTPHQWLQTVMFLVAQQKLHPENQRLRQLFDQQQFDLLLKHNCHDINKPELLANLLFLSWTIGSEHIDMPVIKFLYELAFQQLQVYNIRKSSNMEYTQYGLHLHRKKAEEEDRAQMRVIGLLHRYFDEMVGEVDTKNDTTMMRYEYIVSSIFYQCGDLAQGKQHLFKMLMANGIESINSYIIEDVLFKLRTRYFISERNDPEDTQYDEMLHVLEARLSKTSASIEEVLVLAYLWYAQNRIDYTQHFMKMALQCKSKAGAKRRDTHIFNIWDDLILLYLRNKQFDIARQSIQEVQALYKKSTLRKQFKLIMILRLVVYSEHLCDYPMMDTYLNQLKQDFTEKELLSAPHQMKSLEDAIVRLFSKRQYGLLIKMAAACQSANVKVLFYEGASLFYCHKPQKSLKVLLEFQKMAEGKGRNGLDATTMLADCFSIMSHIYDSMNQLFLMESYQMKALQAYTLATNIQPTDVYTHHQVALYSMKLDHNLNAVGHLRKVLKLSRSLPRSSKQFIYEFDMASCCGKLGLARQQAFHLQLCAKLQQNSQVLLQLMKCYRHKKNQKSFYKAAAKFNMILDNESPTRKLRHFLKDEKDSVKLLVMFNKLPHMYMEHPAIYSVLSQLKNGGSDIEPAGSLVERCAMLILCKRVRVESLLVAPKIKSIAANAKLMQRKLIK